MPRSTPPRKPNPLPGFLTQNEMLRLLSLIKSKRDLAIFKVAYRHVLRASEVGLLERDHVDFKRARITLTRLKGSLSGVYPMSADTVKAIRSYLRTRKDDSPFLFISNRSLPIDRRMLWLLMQQYGEKAGIPPKKREFHILKHSICTHLIDASEDIYFVKDWAGHKKIENTLIYARMTTPTRDARARKIFASSFLYPQTPSSVDTGAYGATYRRTAINKREQVADAAGTGAEPVVE